MSQQEGSISFFNGAQFPALVLPTYLGNLLYSTPDLVSELSKPVFGQVDTNDVHGRAFGNAPLSDVQKAHQNIVGIVSCRQKDLSGGATDDGLYLNTSAGRKLLANTAFISRISLDGFPAVIALADEVPLRSTYKRSAKSNNRGLRWLKDIKTHLTRENADNFVFAVTGPMDTAPNAAVVPVLPSPLTDASTSSSSTSPVTFDRAITESAKLLLAAGADGLVVGGAGRGESLVDLATAIRSVKSVATSVGDCAPVATNNSSGSIATTEGVLGGRKKTMIPVFVQGMNTFRQVLLAISEGADLIGSELPTLLTAKGLSLIWDLDHIGDLDIDTTNVSSSSSSSESRTQHPLSDPHARAAAHAGAAIQSQTTHAVEGQLASQHDDIVGQKRGRSEDADGDYSTSTNAKNATIARAGASDIIISSSAAAVPEGLLLVLPLSGGGGGESKKSSSRANTDIEESKCGSSGSSAGNNAPAKHGGSSNNASKPSNTSTTNTANSKKAKKSNNKKTDATATGTSRSKGVADVRGVVVGGDDDDAVVDVAKHDTPEEYLAAESSGYLANLWDDKFRKDLKPLMESCNCHACRNHTRAYVHHLLRAKELLGEVLLYCHNQKQMLLLFEAVRTHKQDGTYEKWSQALLKKLARP